ncbi:MAG TPA: hypothetical protein EYP41_17665 [Anaerolineae bacterium]|nr:hypothetical protein [Anaerolineae bacterium]HIP72869.1 hypothetical protein [Anaerolineae bacterium]
MERKLIIWVVLTGILVFILAACAPSSATNSNEEPLYKPAQTEETVPSSAGDESEAVSTPVLQGTLSAITRESTEDLSPATVVPEAAISLPEGKIVTPPPPADPARKPLEDEFVRMAKEDLSQRLDIPPEEIELIDYEEVQWRDGSLGCPQPKMRYIQVITPGYRIQLNAQGQMYNYHGAANREPFLCTLKLGSKDIPAPPPPNMDE